jgi:PAS domain S-box-containing protein
METILDRQLRRLGLDADTPPSEAQWRALLDRVRRTYGEFERDRYTIERSLERMSSEMLDLNDDLRAASARQLVEQERLRAVISALGDGLGALDRDGRLVLLNVAGARLVGADASELVGRRLLERFELHVLDGGEAHAIGHGHLLARLAQAEALRDENGLLHAVDGRVVPVDVVLNPVVQKGVVAGAVLLFRDVAAQRQADDELRRARSDAESASRAKGEFLAVMSHEIRTPLNAVIGMTSLLLETILTDEQRDHAETVRRSGEALLAVINDILDFSKVESGRLDLEEIDFDLLGTLDDIASIFGELASRKGVELIVWASPETPARLRGDPSRLRQVLVNLVGNALKFTREGEVVVRAMCGSSSRDEHVMRFEVRDSGVGIAPSAQASLFQPFSQADSSTTRRYGGTGLGLAICRRLTTLMGGEIEVESELGRGSTFRFTVRLRPPQEAPPASPHGAALAGRRILVVDGSEATRALITELAGHCGAVVDGDAAAREAVARLRGPLDARYDVVLLDAGLSAPERAEVVAAATGPAGAPAVVTLGAAVRGGGVRVASDPHLLKPLRSSHFSARLAGILAGEGVPATRSSRPPAPPGDKPARFDGARVLVVEDNAVNQKVITRLLQRFGLEIDVANDGLEALAALERRAYALVFMDCQMPEMDGYAATRCLREAEELTGARTTVVAMTAHALQGERERCLEAGMDDYLSKPIALPPLAAMLRRWIAPASPPP